MPSYAIFVGFPAEDWQGPALVQWEAGLVERSYLALRAEDGEGSEGSGQTRWIGCQLGNVEQVRWCEVAGGPLACYQAEVLVRGTGTLHVYASKSCLDYLRLQGVPVAEMGETDAAACRALWAELAEADRELSGEVCGLVNSALT